MKKLILMLFTGFALLSSCAKEDTAPSGNNSNSSGTCSTVQCSATTQQNVRCTRTTTNCSGLCWQHD